MTNISLVITAYDKDYHLIYSLLDELSKQTEAPSEIIFYCSGVSYLKDILETIKIANRDIPIYTIFNKKRTNQAIARNICAKTALSDILVFFDVDDMPNPSKIQITNHIFKNNNIDFLLHNYNQTTKFNIHHENYFDQPYTLYDITECDPNPLSTNVVCQNFPIHHAHLAVKRSVFQKVCFNESEIFYRKEDGKFCQDLIKSYYIGKYCPFKLINYIS